MNNIVMDGINPCCSCGLCAVICPTCCVDIKQNEEGFYRPVVKENECTGCGLCVEVCYKFLKIHGIQATPFEGKKIYGAWSRDRKIRQESSSGGVGHELVLKALADGYFCCGVVFNANYDFCAHSIAGISNEAEKFQSSKYLQSYTVEAFSKFKIGQKYLVVGTPCQIYGLRKLIQYRRVEKDFLLLDFFCHGTPTVLLWHKYKKYLQDVFALGNIISVDFRSKMDAKWHSYGMKVIDEDSNEYFCKNATQFDLFSKFYLSDSCLNESCYRCKLRSEYCASDIRLADFWGDKYATNEYGVSLVILNTESGGKFFNNLKERVEFEECEFKDLQNSQRSVYYKKHKHSDKVGALLKSDLRLDKIYERTIKLNLFTLIKNRIRNIKRLIFV